VLALAAVPLLGARAIAVPVVLVGMMFLPVGTIKQEPGEKVLFEAESPYQYVQVSEAADGQRILRLNEGWALHSVVPAGGGALTGGYWDAFLTLPLLTGTPDARIAILGNAGGTTARSFRLTSPQVRIDGVEIDPVVTEAGNRYLDMAGPNLTTHEADARFWLAGDRGPFDAVIVDAYRQPYIPFHLSTVEFFGEVRDRLAPGGVAAINVGTPPDQTEVVDRIASTMRSVFPTVLTARYGEFNSVVLGFMDAADAADARARLARATGDTAVAARILSPLLTEVPAGGDVFTDDHAPVEQLTDGAILDYLNKGAPGA
jgi:spermidine synthase